MIVLRLGDVRGALVAMLCVRLGRMGGRSVRWMFVVKRAEKARPTRPVPEPSSRTWRGEVVEGGLRVGGGSLSSFSAVGEWWIVQGQEG